MQTIRVWDLPTRLFHWCLALCLMGLLITGNIGGNSMIWHGRLGYAILTLLLFRLVWGYLGGYYSRFGSFLFAPRDVLAYLRGQGPAEHGIGHTPLGAFSVFAMLAVLILQVASGLFADDEIAFMGPLAGWASGDWVREATSYHKNIGKFIVIALVVMHLLAIVFYKLVKKQGLVHAMVVGDKMVPLPAPVSRDDARSRWMALLVLLLCSAAVFGLVRMGERVASYY